MGNGRGQPRPLTAEQIAEMQEYDRQFRLISFPPQLDINNMERLCIQCQQPLHPTHNRNYDGTVGGYCNKICRKEHERKLSESGMSMVDVDIELDKYEDWKPKIHSTVV